MEDENRSLVEGFPLQPEDRPGGFFAEGLPVNGIKAHLTAHALDLFGYSTCESHIGLVQIAA